MKKLSAMLIVVLFAFSCEKQGKEHDKLEIAKEFYSAIHNSNSHKASTLITKKFKTIDDGFNQEYIDKEGFIDWIKWDSVFQPSYKILKIEEEKGVVKAKVSKMDRRISFLHYEPILTDQTIKFKGNKISSIERSSTKFFVNRWVENRDGFVNWIAENHPELDGFIFDQTKNGALNYLKAIELYEDSRQSIENSQN